jgi:hypothetical protein
MARPGLAATGALLNIALLDINVHASSTRREGRAVRKPSFITLDRRCISYCGTATWPLPA